MPASSSPFSPKAFSFLRQLARNNKREWFQPRKETYEREIREPMLAMIALVNDDLRMFAADYVTEPKRAMYRPYRDTRFAKDKTPYKTNASAMFSRRELGKNNAAGFYFSVSHTEVEIAAGVYIPRPMELFAVRRAIAADPKGFVKLLNDRTLRRVFGEVHGASLARLPRGFESLLERDTNDCAQWVRRKQLYFDVTLPAKVATTSKLRREITNRFKSAVPVVEFINSAIRRSMQDDKASSSSPRPHRPTPMF